MAVIKFIRITPDAEVEVNKDEVMGQFLTKYPDAKIIVAEEMSRNQTKHFHVMLETSAEMGTRNQNLRKFVNQLYGDGNEHYSISPNVLEGTEKRVAAYTIKDGNYVQRGYTDEELKIFHRLSTKKWGDGKFKEDYNQIVEKYLTDDTQPTSEFIKSFLDLKVKYNQNINMNNIMNQLMLIYARKRGTERIAYTLYDRLYWSLRNNDDQSHAFLN